MKRRTKGTIKNALFVGLASASIMTCIFSSLPAFADGAGGIPGGGSSTCSNRRQAFGAVCGGSNAYTWVYYTLDSGANTTFSFPGGSAVGTATIRGCSSGFWHLGYYINRTNTVNHPYVQSSSGWYYNPANRTGSVKFNSSSGNAAAQVGSRSTNFVNNGNGTVWNASNADNSLIDGAKLSENTAGGGKRVTAHYYGSPSRVEAEFNIAKNGGITFYDNSGNVISAPAFDAVTWFCYDETMNKTTYVGTSNIYDGTSAKGNNYVVTNTGAETYNLIFAHNIHRNDDGPNSADNEKYYVNSDPDSYKVSDASVNMNKGDNHGITKTIPVTLDPGESKVVWQTLHYESDNQKSSPDATPSGACTLTGGNISGRYCAKLSRNPAKFSGAAYAKINGTDKTDNSVTTITSADGSYTVNFKDVVTRATNDGAGGKVKNQWWTTITDNGTTITSKNDNGETIALAAEKSHTAKDYNDYSYSGTLRYGETRTICNVLTFYSIIDKDGGNTTGSASICVKVKRDNAKCPIDNSITYGIITAKNAGRLKVENKTLGSSKSSVTGLTDSNPTSAISIYARPGDNIRFSYDMCAGSLYPIKENGLSAAVSYKASGWSSKQTAVNSGNKFLFRSEVPLIGNTYNNPRTWSSSSASSGAFLSSSSNVIGAFTSPSNDAGDNYRCGTPQSGWYQIAGKENCGRNHSSYNTGILDVGSRITQKLEWDEQPVVNGTLSGGTHERSATADVVVPYNYVLKPYVINPSLNGRPAYIGETISMTPGVVVAKRKNLAIGSDNNKNTYATITKNTNIKYFYFFTDSSGTMIGGRQEARASEDRRFNKDGSLDNVNEPLDAISVTIDDSHSVGNRVCIGISVFPYDSHDGGTNENNALREGSSLDSSANRRSIVSCLTIAKRPTISVESSNVYSETSITASYYSKQITGNRFIFSSWSEYGVFGKINKDYLMASGAATGYRRDGYTGGKTLNTARSNPADDNVSRPSNSSNCTFMTQTFANSNCEQNSSAKAIGGVTAEQYENRIKERFEGAGKNLSGVSSKSFGNVNYLDASNINAASYLDQDASLVGVKADNIYISKTPSFPDDYHGNRTVVYHAKNLVIDGDLNKEYDKNLVSPSSITGIVIFAENVFITDSTKYINATIISDSVNTCAFRSSNPAVKLEMKDLNSKVCNGGLIFDAPVVTHRLILNRTAGATSGDGSITRAEVFNLNTGNYLWSYSQMSRYNQAITSYSRELPPRY